MTARLPTTLASGTGAVTVRTPAPSRDLSGLRAALGTAGVEVRDDDATLDEHARDWWPVSIGWAAHGELLSRPGLVVAPTTTEQVAAVVVACQAAQVAFTPQGGRSGVCGGAVPEPGAVAIDLTGLSGVVHFDEVSLRVRVAAGTFGPDLESWLRARNCTLGHFPQSMDISTVGGWIACRSAGQYSTRYGKIEDLVRGLTVVLADGTVVVTGGAGPRQAVGPDLTQLFVGAEGTLGIVTEVELAVHAVPGAQGRRAFSFDDFASGLDACRRVLQRGATPAVLRLYDVAESTRNFQVDRCVLVVLDEADPALLAATLEIVDAECSAARTEDVAHVEHWLVDRNDVSALGPLWEHGFVVDTMETAASWSALPEVHRAVCEAMLGVAGTSVATVHQSHAYTDGACLYFTFAGRPEDPDAYYDEVWDAATHAALASGASLSHHHGVGRNRRRFVAQALGPGTQVLVALKGALDPNPRGARVTSQVLVVDVGTSSVRSSLVAPDGTVTSTVQVPVLPSTPEPGTVEVDPHAIKDAVLTTAASVLERGGPVDGVGVTNQRATTVVWDQSTGRAVGPGIGWQDLRTVVDCLVLQGQGVRLAPNQSATKLKWLVEHAGDDQRSQEALRFGTIDTWVIHVLSNGALHVTDATNAGVTGLVAPDAEDWDLGVLDALGLDPTLLPTIVDTVGSVGPASVLEGSPPICSIVGDQQGSLAGQGCVAPGDAKLTFGTGGMLDEVLEARPAFSRQGAAGCFPIVARRRDGRVIWGLEAVQLTAGTCIEWLRDDLGLVDSAAETDVLAATVRDTADVAFVPALLGIGTPEWDFGARGAFFGLTRGATKAHLVRAVLEGIAQRGRDLVESAEHDGERLLRTLRVDGGMSANATFLQLLADVTGRAVEVSPVLEATSRGAGLLAHLALGNLGDESELAGAWRPSRVLEPLMGDDERASRRAAWLQAKHQALRTIPGLSDVAF
jgi:glycerol kinase